MRAFPFSRRCAPLLLALLSPAAASAATVSGLYADFLTSRFAAEEADTETAARDALRALALDPSQYELINQAFVQSALAGRPEALGLARLLPQQVFAVLMTTNEAIRQGDWQEAGRLARTLPGGGLTDVLRPVLLAWVAEAEGDAPGALQRLRSAESGEQARFSATFALHAGMIADLAGRAEDAASLFEQAQQGFPQPSLRQAEILGGFYARHGRQAQALGLLAKASAAAPDLDIVVPDLSRRIADPAVASAADGIAEAYLAAAGSMAQQGQNEAAMLLLRFALSLRPDFAEAKLALAEQLAGEGRIAESREILGGIPASDRLRPLARLRDADLQRQSGNSAAALAAYETLARDYPQSAAPLTRAGDLLRAEERFTEAADAYDRALARAGEGSPNAWALFYARAVCRDRQGDWTAAEADLRRGLELAPGQPLLLNYLGYSLTERGEKLTEAREMIERAIKADPNDGAIADSLGWVMLKQGDVPDAIRELEHAVELQPADPTINAHLGDAYSAAGRGLEATYQWERALTLHPDAKEAERLKVKLEGGARQASASPSTTD